MSDSTDNTAELDSYGVWVKRPGTTEDPVTDSLDSDIFDIPDMAAEDLDLSDFDTEIGEVAEEPVEEATDDLLLDDLEIEEAPEALDEVEEADSIEEIDVSDFELPEEDGEISLDEFMDEGFSDESVASGNNGFAPGEETVSLDEFSDGELSLDDFLDGGDFTTGPAPEVKPQQEEIVDEKPLEMDISFDSSVESIETEDNIQTDETFDTEDDFVADDADSFVHDGATHSTEVFGDTEEIDLSDFGIDADAEETPITQNVEESKMKDKVVDFDLCVSDEKMASAPIVEEVKDAAETEVPEETLVEEPVVQEAPVAEAVVQPVAQSNENTALLQQIISELSGMKAEIDALKTNLEQIQSQKNEPVVEEGIIPEATAEESSGFFDDTDGDDTIALSGDELDNMLNTVELSESTEEPVIEEEVIEESVVEEPVIEETAVEEPVIEEEVIEETVAEEPVIEETAVEEPVIEEDEIEIPETTEDDSLGFFDDTDGDDTIALSGDELDNMLSGVELSEASETTEEPVEEEIIEDISEESILEEELDDIPEEIDIEPVPTETVEDDIFGAIDESEDEVSETDNFIEETVIEDSEEALEEPNLDDFDDMNFDETEETSEDLPDEISITKTDDIDSILVESSNDDFMNSVVDTTEEDTAPVEDFEEFMNGEQPVEESLTDSNLDYLSEEETLDEIIEAEPEETVEVTEEEPVVEETVEDTEEDPVVEETVEVTEEEPVVEETVEDDFPSVDFFTMDEPAAEEGFLAETPVTEEEPVIEETEIVEEVPVEEEIVETAVSEEEVAVAPVETEPESTADAELKKDIKSVLLYMDQLLENLPEEKIVEFAKSEEFATYKKLFTELGLEA
ncbi:MAG: hypothetical protein MJ181_08805 [Treponema sp.]|nr:hypothetical protein [Treponema sp.]